MFNERHSAAARENQKKAAEANRKPKIERACERCGAIRLLRPSEAARGEGRFCSRSCCYAAMRGNKGANAGGGGWMKGAGNPNWKDGISQQRTERERHNAARQQWRRIFARDANTCQHCGFVGRNRDLQAHHIKPWATHPALRTDMANGITLCKPCHDKVHHP